MSMSQRDELFHIEDMLDYARYALEFVEGRVANDIQTDRQLAFALVRALEVIGESASRVPKTYRARYPQIPWGQIVGMRNALIHGYTKIDYELIWDVTVDQLPRLVEQLEAILEEEVSE
jgi:uncharacterized protein with HEPN domain